jgi:hypothetical protein
MIKTKTNSQTTTYDWLLSILKNSLISAIGKIELWQDKRAYAVECRDKERGQDQAEYDGWSERINLNDDFVVNAESLRRLKVAVEGNPYPGRQIRVQQVAVEQVPETGKFRWRLIFEDTDFGFPVNFANQKICFPVLVELTVEDIEKVLFELVREDNTILASDVPEALNLKANGKAYREVKSKLEERGWSWRQRKEEGKVVKIVEAPR